MKRIYRMIAVLCLCMFFASNSAFADTERRSGLFSYSLKGNGNAVITGFDWNSNGSGDIYVPRQIDGYNVTEIGAYAFSSESADLDHIIGAEVVVILPDTITIIGEKAFFCTRIASCTIPSSVQLIGAGAFAGCKCLRQHSVDANNSTYATIDGVLYNKVNKTLVSAPAGLRYDEEKFSVPEGITGIGDYAFYGMTLDAWSKGDYCIGIDIASTVESIGKYAFAYIDAKMMRTVGYYGYTFDLARVKTIDDYAFYHAGVFGFNWDTSRVESIGKYSFAYTSLFDTETRKYSSNDTFPATLTTIEEGSFYQCGWGYNTVDFSNTKIQTIPTLSFYSSGASLILPNGIRSIEEHAFENSSVSLEIPSAVRTIGEEAFKDSELYGLAFADASELKEIGAKAFENSNFVSTEILTLPEGVESIGDRAFFSTGIDTLIIPSTVNSIGDSVCDRSITKLGVETGSFAALYASENGYSVSSPDGDDTSWLNN